MAGPSSKMAKAAAEGAAGLGGNLEGRRERDAEAGTSTGAGTGGGMGADAEVAEMGASAGVATACEGSRGGAFSSKMANPGPAALALALVLVLAPTLALELGLVGAMGRACGGIGDSSKIENTADDAAVAAATATPGLTAAVVVGGLVWVETAEAPVG